MSDIVPAARIVKLVSNDGKEFEISRTAIKRVGILEKLIGDLILDDAEGKQTIPIPEINSATLKMVVDYCIQHKEDPIRSPLGLGPTVPRCRPNKALQFDSRGKFFGHQVPPQSRLQNGRRYDQRNGN